MSSLESGASTPATTTTKKYEAMHHGLCYQLNLKNMHNTYDGSQHQPKTTRVTNHDFQHNKKLGNVKYETQKEVVKGLE